MADWHLHPRGVPRREYVPACPECVRIRGPLRPETFAPPMRDVVLWHLLLTEAEELSRRTGLGLAGLWSEIRRGGYSAAREHLDHLLAREADR